MVYMEDLKKLPSSIQYHILEFSPRVPRLPKEFFQVLHHHYSSKRVCRHCGRFLPIRRKKYYCLCRSKYKKYSFSDSKHGTLKVYLRPNHSFPSPFIPLRDYQAICRSITSVKQSSHRWFYLASRQDPFVFQFKESLHFLYHLYLTWKSRFSVHRLPWLEWFRQYQQHFDLVFPKQKWQNLQIGINTNTCIRRVQDVREQVDPYSPIYFRHLQTKSLFSKDSYLTSILSYDHVFRFWALNTRWVEEHFLTFHDLAFALLCDPPPPPPSAIVSDVFLFSPFWNGSPYADHVEKMMSLRKYGFPQSFPTFSFHPAIEEGTTSCIHGGSFSISSPNQMNKHEFVQCPVIDS